MSDFQNLSNTPDILAVPQPYVVMLVAHLVSGISKDLLDPEFFDFSYRQVDSEKVEVSFTGRAYSTTGKHGIWTGTKKIELVRAKLNRGVQPIELVVAYRLGMTFEHILRALQVTYEMNVTAAELLVKDPVTELWGAINETVRPSSTVLDFKFGEHQARIIPEGSEFRVCLDNSDRPDINEYLTLIKAGSVLGGL